MFQYVSSTLGVLYQYRIEIMIALAALLMLLLVFGKIPLAYNLRNLTVRWRTTAMTALAFTLVISLLTVMLAFVNGMYRLTEGTGRPGNVILLSQGVTDEAFSNLGFSDTGDIQNQPLIVQDETLQRPLCSKETFVVVNQPIEGAPPSGPKRRFSQIRGIEDPQVSARVHGIRLYPGGVWFSQSGVQAREGSNEQDTLLQAVLGEGAARVIGGDPGSRNLPSVKAKGRLDAGDQFSLGGRTWIVVGVMKSSGSTFDSEIWAKRQIVGTMFGKDSYTSLVVRGADDAAAQQLKNFFNNEYKKASLQALVETEYFASLSKTNDQFLYAIQFVAAIMAIGGVFGVMNTMFAAVSQRTKDIGVLRILGYARWQILVSFLFESLLIAVVGGALGCVLGTLADGWTASSIVSGGQGGGKFVVLRLTVDAGTLLSGAALTIFMGIAGGLLPAISAMRVRPLESLR